MYWIIPVPLWLFTREYPSAAAPDSFCVEFEMTAPRLGLFFSYNGEFRIVNASDTRGPGGKL